MQQTTFRIAKMDCPAEEQMIRMKLDGLDNIQSLEFNIPKRQLKVIHNADYIPILERLESLKFDTTLVESIEASDAVNTNNSGKDRRLLWQVLAINILFFAVELSTGLLSDSMGLVADSLDMLADSIVYALSLFAVGGSIILKKNIAKTAGIFQFILAVAGFAEVVRRFVGVEEMPGFQTMIIISLLALGGNALSLYLLQKSKSEEAHMRASMIFTSNDIIINLGVIVAGVLVYFTQSRYPDLIIGTIVFFIVGKGAFKILQLSK